MRQATHFGFDREFTIALVAILLMIAATLVGMQPAPKQGTPGVAPTTQTTQTADYGTEGDG